MEGNLGQSHSGELHRESAEQKADHVMIEEMSRLGWTEADLASRLKNDPCKLAMAARLRKETTLSIKWIAARLQMGTAKSLKPMLYDWMKAHDQVATRITPSRQTCQQLQFQPPADPCPLAVWLKSWAAPRVCGEGCARARRLASLP